MARRVKAIELTERRTEAVRLRRSGKSWDQIAQLLGYKTKGAACQDVHRHLKAQVREQASELDVLRALEDGHLDDLRSNMVAILDKGTDDQRMKATDRLVRVAERKARLNGLDYSDELAERQVALAESQAELIATAFRAFAKMLGHDVNAPEVRAAFRSSLELVRGQAS